MGAPAYYGQLQRRIAEERDDNNKPAPVSKKEKETSRHFVGVIVQQYRRCGTVGCYCIPEVNPILAIHLPHKLTDKWRIPGGKPETFETLAMAARRELLEETNVEAKRLKYLGESVKVIDGATWVGHIFLCDEWEGTPAPGDKNDAVEWMTVEELDRRSPSLACETALLKNARPYIPSRVELDVEEGFNPTAMGCER